MLRVLPFVFHNGGADCVDWEVRMLDLARLKRIKLAKRPPGQVFMANVLLRMDYAFPRRTEILLDGIDAHLKRDTGYIFAMNHTDRFNYWPFQWQMWKEERGFTATWVKGKYYENNWIGLFMDSMNNIPLPSRGYVLASRFRKQVGRPPEEDEYRWLRSVVDGLVDSGSTLPAGASPGLEAFFGTSNAGAFLAAFEPHFDDMIREVVRLSRRAIEVGNHLLIFPEGTRSLRLGKGHTGLAQIAQHLRVPVVPVGCNGSHRLYPGNSPFSKGGKVVYRIGEPIFPDSAAVAEFQVPQEVLPFTRQATQYKAQYQGYTDVLMERIAGLLDDEHLPLAAEHSATSDGVGRFL